MHAILLRKRRDERHDHDDREKISMTQPTRSRNRFSARRKTNWL
jgi:hypothetical protein